MSLSDDIRGAISAAREAVSDLLVTVQHLRPGSRDAYSEVFLPPIDREAIWEDSIRIFWDNEGQEQLSIGTLTFLEPIEVGAFDRFRTPTMAPDESSPVLKTEGIRDKLGAPMMVVHLGRVGRGFVR